MRSPATAAAWRRPRAVHINLFGPHPIVVYGTPEQKARWVPRLIAGEDQCCFGFTEPDAGLNTTAIKTFATKVDGGYVVRGQKVWTSTAQVANKIMLLTRTTKLEDCQEADRRHHHLLHRPRSLEDRRHQDPEDGPQGGRFEFAIFIDDLFIPDSDRIGEEGKGFGYILHSLNPERVLIAIEAIGIGQDALRRAAKYAPRARGVWSSDRYEPGHPASARGKVDVSWKLRSASDREGRLACTTSTYPAVPKRIPRSFSARAPVSTPASRQC